MISSDIFKCVTGYVLFTINVNLLFSKVFFTFDLFYIFVQSENGEVKNTSPSEKLYE